MQWAGSQIGEAWRDPSCIADSRLRMDDHNPIGQSSNSRHEMVRHGEISSNLETDRDFQAEHHVNVIRFRPTVWAIPVIIAWDDG
jgi:hypothetical protein